MSNPKTDAISECLLPILGNGRDDLGLNEIPDMNAVRDLAFGEIAKTWSLSAFGDSELSPCENGFDWLPGSHTVHVRIFDDERKSESPLPGRFRITIFTDFLRSVPVLSDKFTHLVGASSKFLSSGYSFVYP